MGTAVLSSIPVWTGLLVAWWMEWPMWALITLLCITLTISLATLAIRFRWTKCPSCGHEIRVPWSSSEYRRGGMLRYQCDKCHIIWRIHVFPGSGT